MFLCKQASPGSKKIVGVFYKANEYAAMNPNFLGCVERALGIGDWLESQGHQYIVTDDKEGPVCGKYIDTKVYSVYMILGAKLSMVTVNILCHHVLVVN